MHSAWTETIVAVASPHAEIVASFLLDLGSPGLVTDDSEPMVTLTAYFPADAREPLAALRDFCARLARESPTLAPASIQTRRLRQEDWARNWMEHFPPLAVGERLYVIPPWIDEVPSDRVAVVIDPGLAFGTGHHATTQGCLTLLERRARAGGVRRALDLGTGSGILAIALAKLGVDEVWAVDTDADACRVARENCARNAVADRVRIRERLGPAAGPFDLIAANLFGPQLIELSAMLAGALAPRGHLIASGLLIGEAAAVTAAFAAQHLVERERVEQSSIDSAGSPGDWVTLDLARSPR